MTGPNWNTLMAEEISRCIAFVRKIPVVERERVAIMENVVIVVVLYTRK